MRLNRILMSVILCTSIATECFASVMGDKLWASRTDFGAGANMYTTAYKNGSTNQQEFYVEYLPNPESVPVVLNGEQIYGKRTILQAAKYYDDLNYRPLIGINADYFSLKTGIPMGHTISGGKLLTKDDTGQNAVGFRADGTGFISWLQIETKLIRENESEMTLECINKWCFEGATIAYFLSDEFGKETKTPGQFKYVIFSKTDGEIKIGEEAEFIVEEKFDADINIGIPEDKYVLVMDRNAGNPEQLAFMDSLQVGEKIKMTNEAVYDSELWESAENGLGSIGGRLIENGTVYTEFEAGTAPRTAVGITEDGVLIFYVVDGRQSGYSAGLSLKNLAQRMSELGCVDAINLDGGGSTAIAGVYPGSSTFDVINSPSDGTLRSCANYIFLQDMREPTGVAKTIVLENKQNQHYLTGTSAEVKVESVWDSANYKMEIPQIGYEVINGDGTESEISGNKVTLLGNGTTAVEITAAEASTQLNINVYDFPDEIKTYDESGKEISFIKLEVGDNYSKKLNSTAYKGQNKLIADSSCFEYTVEGEIGEFNGSKFIANTGKETSGKIIVKAGQAEKIINVEITDDNHFDDMRSHWAKDAVNTLYKKGIVSGVNNAGKWHYNPDNVMTRIEFSSLICKYLEININEFDDVKLQYKDKAELKEWMIPYEKAMTELGIINGIDGKFKPNEPLTRAQAVTIIGRTLPEEEDVLEIEANDINDIPDWAYSHFEKLITYDIIHGYEDNTLRPNKNVTRAEAAAIIYNMIKN